MPFFAQKDAPLSRRSFLAAVGSVIFIALSISLAAVFAKTQDIPVLSALIVAFIFAVYCTVRLLVKVHQRALLREFYDELYCRVSHPEAPFQCTFNADNTEYLIVHYAPNNTIVSELTQGGDRLLVIRVAKGGVSTSHSNFAEPFDTRRRTFCYQKGLQKINTPPNLTTSEAIKRLHDIVQLTPAS